VRAALLAFAVCLAPATAARAGEPSAEAGAAPRLQLFAGAGAAWAVSDDLKALGFGAGPAFELGGAVRVVPHLAVGASAGYLAFADAWSRRRGTSDLDAPLEQVDVDRKATAVPLLAFVRVSGGWRGLEAFARAGAGVAFASHDVSSRSSVTGSWSYSGSDAALAVQLGAGVSAAVSARISAGVEASYLRARPSFPAPPSTDTAHAAGGGAMRIDTVAVCAALTYRP
jgi:opacity protein-like surface antigen